MRHSFALSIFLIGVSLLAQGQNWLEIRSPHFTVVTDAGDRRGREVALRFEQMRTVFGSLILREKMNTTAPLAIIAFKDRKELEQVAPLWKGKPIEIAGVYFKGEDKHFIALDLSSERGYPVVFHEYAHMLLNSNYPESQAWFDEGFAEYYSTIKITKTQVQIGLPPEYIGATLAQGLMPIEKLFSISHNSKEYNESGNRRTLFYAQSWLMVHYIFDMKKMKQLADYFDLAINEKMPVHDAIKKAFRMEPKQLDKELYGYLHSRDGVSFTWPVPAGIEDATYQHRKMKDIETESLIADIHLHSSDRIEQAVGEYQAILKKNPQNAEAYRGLGYASLHKGDMENAIEHFKKAASLGSNDARVYYYVAFSLMRNAGNLDAQPQILVDMSQALDKAIQLDPEYADAYNLKGFALGNARNYPEAIKALKTAVKLRPRNEQYQSNLALQYLAAQKYDDAIAIFDHLKQSDDPNVASAAASQLATAREWKEKPLLQLGAEDYKRNESSQWQPKGDSADKDELKQLEDAQHGVSAADTRPTRYVSGRLVGVDCSREPKAILSVKDGAKNYKLSVASINKVLVMGADQFSCLWKDRKISVNYKESAPLQGDVMSVEVY